MTGREADEGDEGFLSRWSRRKSQARRDPAPTEPPAVPPAGDATRAASDAPADTIADERAVPPPTLADAEALTPESDFTRFVAAGVTADVKNAALKKLFADPRFNEMDGLDAYIDDYTRPDPIPADVLARLAQAQIADPVAPPAAAPAPPGRRAAARTAGAVPDQSAPDAAAQETATDEDADLRLQPHDAARCAGAEPGAGGDGGCGQRRTG